jgi:CHAT domain-containing protein/tetratricopeptide (TPR) repeat protein
VEEKSTEITARRFLSRGIVKDTDEKTLAAACEQYVQKVAHRSLKDALPICHRFAARAQTHGGRLLLQTAYRALARVTHMRGAHAPALAAYLEARRFASEQPLVRARIDRALVDVYMYLGKFEQSRKSAQSAIRVFTRLKADSDLAQTRVNYANSLHRQDRHRDAERLYREAADYFEATSNTLAAARCYYNRANTLVQLFDLATAEALYKRAAEIYEGAGLVLESNDARYGLAWLKMLQGSFHIALLDLNTCQRAYREGGDPRGEALCILDRAEVCLGLGLHNDALEASRAAEKLFAGLGLRYEIAKSALFRAQAATALGRRSEALTAIERAKSGFRDEKNTGFQGVSHLFASDIENDERKRRLEIREARSKFAKAQLPLWEAVCDLRDAFDSKLAVTALNRLRTNRAAMHVPHLYALWQTALGDQEHRRGHLESARQYWTKAADRLDFVRAQLPPVELRTAFARRSHSPHLRLISEISHHDPRTAAVWSERYSTAGVWSPLSTADTEPTSRRQVTESLDALASQVALLSRNISGYGGERGIAAAAGRKALTSLQRKVRDGLIAVERNNKGNIDSADKLSAEFARVSVQVPIVQFHIDNEDVLAFVHQQGKTALHRLHNSREQLDRLLRRWRFVMESELLAERLGQTSHQTAEHDLWSDLGNLLWKPLEIDRLQKKVLILPEGELANIPWEALIADGQLLATSHQFVIAPSLRHHLAARQVKPESRRIEIFRGTAADIPHVDNELQLLAEQAGGNAVMHNPCGRADWPSEGSARLWHFAGHAVLRNDNPFYSYLLLEDGPLFAADFRLRRCSVGLATLAACRTGEQVMVPGEETTGLVRSLLEMGARNVLAGHWPVSDRSTAAWMGAFYKKLLAGDDLLESAAFAAESVRETYPSAFYWAAFSVFGAGDMGVTYEKNAET